MACSKEDQDALFIGSYLWDKVGSKSSFKRSNVPRKNTSTVVTSTSKGGLAQDVVGVFTTIGSMAFFVDIYTLMNLPRYTFGEGVPNKVHMSVPLQVPMLVQQELDKRLNNGGMDEAEDGGDMYEFIGGSESDDEGHCEDVPQTPISQTAPFAEPPPAPTPERRQPIHPPANSKARRQVSFTLPENASIPVGDIPLPPPTPAPETAHLTAAQMFSPQGVPMVIAYPGQPRQQPAQKRGCKTNITTTTQPKKPRAPRTRKQPATAATPLEVAAYEETIEQVAGGMLPTNDPVEQAAANAGITAIVDNYHYNDQQ